MNRQYIAGFFDGEGCVSLKLTNKRSSFQMVITISQHYSTVLFKIQEYLGYGYVNSNMYRVHKLKDVKRFIKLVLPYSIVKKRQLQVALECLNQFPQLSFKEKLVYKQILSRMKRSQSAYL